MYLLAAREAILGDRRRRALINEANVLMSHTSIVLNLSKTQTETVVQPDGVVDDFGRKSISAVAWCVASHQPSLPVSAST